MAVEITQNLTQVTISSAGVQGLKGETGPAGASADSSALVTTSSFNQFTSSIQSDVNSIKAWTASLELINTIDTELLQFYQTTASLNTQTGSLIGITNRLMAFTAALDLTYASDAQLYQIYQATRSMELHSGSMAGITNGLMAYTSSNESWKTGIRSEISAIEAWTSSLELINTIDTELLQLYQTTASLNSKTGSYATTGSNTFNGNQTINGYITLQNGAVIKDTSNNGVSFGYLAGDINQGTQSLALGNGAGYQNQSHGTVAIGTNAGAVNQGLRATALGSLAGTYNQGEYAVAIGNYAAPNNQASHSIVISALGTALENTISNSLIIAPIRNISGGDGVLQYNNTTKEVSYSNSISSSILISGSIVPSVAEGSYTSSFSLGSSTNAWKDIWVSEGSINFVNSLTGATSSISLNTTTNEIIVSNLSINTASLDSRIVAIENAALSASFFTSSIQFTSSFDERYTQTSSLNTFTASFNAISSSFATTGSNTFIGNQIVSGSFNVSGSTVQSGNNTLTGNTILSGSISISGSTTFNGVHTLSGSNTIVGNTIMTGTNTIIGNTKMSGSIDVSGSSNFHNSIFIVTGSQFYTGSSDFKGNQTITGSLNVTGNINVESGSGFYYYGNKLFNRGQFYHTATLSGSANTAYPFQYNTTDVSVTNGTVYVDNDSRIYVKHSGIYNVQFSAQLHTTVNQACDFSVWFSMTGSNIENSNTDFSIEKVSGGGFQLAALNYLAHIQSGSYIELYYSKTTANGQIQAKGTQSTPTRPATPSVILTVTQVA
jgi:hypothetical protein